MNGEPAIDGHAHVFRRGLALAAGRRYAPDYDAPLEAYLAMLDANGFGGGVLVQPSFLGTDNGFLLQALRAAPERLRGVAVVDPASGRDELVMLQRQGIVGLRANLLGAPLPDFAAAPWRDLLRQAASLGFHLEVQAEAPDLAAVLPPLLACDGLAIVVDHFGLPDPALGADDPALASALSLVAQAPGRCWIKVSAPYRLGSRGFEVATALIPRLRAAFGLDHLVFGSDWPHTRFEDATRVAHAREALPLWFPDPAERARVTFANAQALFDWSPP